MWGGVLNLTNPSLVASFQEKVLACRALLRGLRSSQVPDKHVEGLRFPHAEGIRRGTCALHILALVYGHSRMYIRFIQHT